LYRFASGSAAPFLKSIFPRARVLFCPSPGGRRKDFYNSAESEIAGIQFFKNLDQHFFFVLFCKCSGKPSYAPALSSKSFAFGSSCRPPPVCRRRLFFFPFPRRPRIDNHFQNRRKLAIAVAVYSQARSPPRRFFSNHPRLHIPVSHSVVVPAYFLCGGGITFHAMPAWIFTRLLPGFVRPGLVKPIFHQFPPRPAVHRQRRKAARAIFLSRRAQRTPPPLAIRRFDFPKAHQGFTSGCPLSPRWIA